MASFTSIASGNWNDGPTTWGTAAGTYPGSTASQSDTAAIAATHNVTINVATAAASATVAVTVNADAGGYGQLTVGANMTAAWITTITTQYYATTPAWGRLVWSTGGTYTLRHSGALTLNGKLDMDGSGASSLLGWYPGGNITFGANSIIVNFKGRTKTVATQFNGTPSATAATVDDVTGWDVGDYIAACKNTATAARVATTNNPVSTSLTYSSTAAMASMQDNGRVINLTRSAFVSGSGQTIVLPAGMTITNLQYVEFVDVKLTFAVVGNPLLFVGCSWYPTANSRCDNTLSASLQISDCVLYMTGTPSTILWSISGNNNLVASRVVCLGVKVGGGQIVGFAQDSAGRVELNACEVGGAFNLAQVTTSTRTQSIIYARNCYTWGATSGTGFSSPGVTQVIFTQCVFGQDVGGNANANGNDISVANACDLVFLEDCLLSASTPVAVGTNNTDPVVISANHGRATGARVEWQRYGVCTKTADTDFVADVCDEIDPSSAAYPFRYRIMFPCVSNATPTLTFNQKMITANGVTGTVVLGTQRAGLTGIATGGTVSVNMTLASHSVTFTGTAALGGMVEVEVQILDGSGTGQLRIGDIAVSGNT